MSVRTWLPDPSHYPEQLTPLSATVWLEAVGHGLHEAMRQLRGPFGGFLARTELGWAYEGELEPDWNVDTEFFETAARGLESRWERELRPRAHEITAQLHRLRPETPDAEGAVQTLRTFRDLVLEQWTIHFLAVIPAQIAIELFEQDYRATLGAAADTFGLYRLLDGIDNDTNRADALLWQLSRRARELAVDDILIEFPPAAALDRLRLTADGRAFLHQLGEYLQRFGGRSRWHELSLPREVEQPWMTFESLRLFLEGDRQLQLTGREDDESAELLRLHPQLETSLRVGQIGYSIKEGHVHHIDYPGLLATREVLLGFARRLIADGTIQELSTLWTLRLDELELVLREPKALDISTIASARRADLEQGRRQGPRPYLGEPPQDTERHAALEKFYGTQGGATASGVFEGTAASPGMAEGPARIVRSADDFSRISNGDVLVATTTTPAWTPVFPSVAAVVTETGGILCHGAIVAREYRIPAVVGVEGATTQIADGARIRVDGNSGTVSRVGGEEEGR